MTRNPERFTRKINETEGQKKVVTPPLEKSRPEQTALVFVNRFPTHIGTLHNSDAACSVMK